MISLRKQAVQILVPLLDYIEEFREAAVSGGIYNLVPRFLFFLSNYVNY